jgi:hypothetical protein
MSADLATKILLGLEQLAIVREQISPLIAKPPASQAGAIETAAASAMLHSFYTEIEKILTLIARHWDKREPASDAWHKELLKQKAAPTDTRPAVITSGLVEVLSEYLAFRHLFRGASIALMRWDKLSPLVAKVDSAYRQVMVELESFREFLITNTY